MGSIGPGCLPGSACHATFIRNASVRARSSRVLTFRASRGSSSRSANSSCSASDTITPKDIHAGRAGINTSNLFVVGHTPATGFYQVCRYPCRKGILSAIMIGPEYCRDNCRGYAGDIGNADEQGFVLLQVIGLHLPYPQYTRLLPFVQLQCHVPGTSLRSSAF